jgi:hypothetical protein
MAEILPDNPAWTRLFLDEMGHRNFRASLSPVCHLWLRWWDVRPAHHRDYRYLNFRPERAR